MKKESRAWIAPQPALHITMAIKGMYAGTANEDQQKAGMRWIINSLCGMDDWPFRPDQRETDIALGRQLVGHAILKEIKLKVRTTNE